MRKWMIFTTIILALLQLWPMGFGRNSNSEVAASMPAPRIVAAVASSPATPIKAVTIKPAGAPQSCYAHYRAVYSACAADDRTCHAHADDSSDLCEATGIWTN